MPTKFHFRWIPFVAAALAACLGISLGQWQTRRAHEKQAIEAKLSAREAATPTDLGAVPASLDELEYRRVRVRGEFIPGWTVYLDNRPYNGNAGFFVLTPLKIQGSDTHVLVARGWVKRDLVERTKIPPIVTPQGTVEIEGLARQNVGHILQLGSSQTLRPHSIVQNVGVEEFAQATKWSMQPVIIEQLTDTKDTLVRDWPRPSTGVEKHLGYAFQWYALAATAMIFFVVTGFRRAKR